MHVSFEDIVILPSVSTALATKTLFQATLSILVGILDHAFPIVMQVARLPLFVARIFGDGVIAVLKALVRFVPVSEARRAQLREIITMQWAWLRHKISYRSFEEAVHRAFERRMEWVFRKCRNLTPQFALLVICGAVLWFPISFGTATTIHALLLANATLLPAWMQLLHFPVAFLAKSKILVLPVYPAAWPQAQRHPLIQAIAKRYQDLKCLGVVQRIGFRYRQTEYAAQKAGETLARLASLVGLRYLIGTALGCFNDTATWTTKTWRTAALNAVESLSQDWLIGSIVRRHAYYLDDIRQPSAAKPSERLRELFERWSIKFSAEYYEAKERETTCLRQVEQAA
jgi:hypothetical protein